MSHLLSAVSSFITQTISGLGYPGVTLLMGIESAAIPLPSEVIMPFAGFLVASGRFGLWQLALAGAVGSTLGSLLTYGIGYYGGRPLMRRYGHFVFLSERELIWTENFFNRFGHYWSTFLGRILPIIRTFISIPAGVGKVRLIPFTITAFVGSFIWSYFLAWLGLKLGENWDHLEIYFRKFDLVIGVIILFGAIYYIYRHVKNRI